MKNIAFILVAVMTMLMASSVTSHAHGGHFRAGVWIGPGWWPAYPYYPGYVQPYYVSPPVAIREAPEEYIQQESSQAPEGTNYWYYCRNPKGYYPHIKRCPDGWLKVAPSPAPPDTEE